ncbi:MAG: phosphatidylserine decarboxylase [Crocinitomicaceae bacterium]|jgi:phosphatidylserine decarboxylase
MGNITTESISNEIASRVHSHAPVVQELKDLLAKTPAMEKALLESLSVAVDAANDSLNDDLYKAINRVFMGNGWPTSTAAYLNYLDQYVRLIPNEEDDTRYPNAWKSNGEQNGYNQKVYDLLCQFYWLVDQQIKDCDQTLQSFPAFSTWLVDFANAWGDFLDTDDSLTRETLNSFKYDTMYNFPLYSDGQRGWKTFNQFFYREFNGANADTGITPLRPIAEPNNNQTIVAGADSTYQQDYPIDESGNVLDATGNKTSISLKHTHTIGTVDELLGGSEYAADFYGGTFVHYFLSPFDYHRFHTPVAGEVLEIEAIPGKVFLNVVMTDDGQWDAPDGADDGYEFVQARGLVIMDAGPVVGKVAVLPIGMAQVSGVEMNTGLKGKTVVKGQEFGKFKFGGSDIILLFQKSPDLYLFKKDPAHNAIHFQYGQTVAYWNEAKQD